MALGSSSSLSNALRPMAFSTGLRRHGRVFAAATPEVIADVSIESQFHLQSYHIADQASRVVVGELGTDAIEQDRDVVVRVRRLTVAPRNQVGHAAFRGRVVSNYTERVVRANICDV